MVHNFFVFQSPEKATEEQLRLYKDELSKLPEKEKRTYLEGFSQALLLNNKNQQAQQAPKKTSLLVRIYIAIVIAVGLAFLSGGEFV